MRAQTDDRTDPRVQDRPFGLVLSGGGARGLARAGCLRALNAMAYCPSAVVGLPMGAVVCATFALNRNWRDALIDMDVPGFPSLPDFSEPGLVRFMKNLRKAQKIAIGMYFGWGVGQSQMESGRHLPRNLICGARAEDGCAPVIVIAPDLGTGQRVVLTEGRAGYLVYANPALTGFVPSAKIGGHTLVDRSNSDTAPVDLARGAGFDVVIAVDASYSRNADLPRDGPRARLRGPEICQNEHARLRYQQTDLVLRPAIDPPVGVLDFSRRKRCSAAGFIAGRKAKADLLHRSASRMGDIMAVPGNQFHDQSDHNKGDDNALTENSSGGRSGAAYGAACSGADDDADAKRWDGPDDGFWSAAAQNGCG